jgi:hypothetical protein
MQRTLFGDQEPRETGPTRAVFPGKVTKLHNRRVYLFRAQDETGKVDGWRLGFKRLPAPEEKSRGLRRVVTEVSLSAEAMQAILEMLYAYAMEEGMEEVKP